MLGLYFLPCTMGTNGAISSTGRTQRPWSSDSSQVTQGLDADGLTDRAECAPRRLVPALEGTTETAGLSWEISAHHPPKGPCNRGQTSRKAGQGRAQLLPPSSLWSFSRLRRQCSYFWCPVLAGVGPHTGFLSTGLGASPQWHRVPSSMHKEHLLGPQGSLWA